MLTSCTLRFVMIIVLPLFFYSHQQRAINFVSPERVYSTFHVYKTRAAMAVRLIPPGFTSENGYKVLVKDGCMLLEFAVSNPGQQPASTSTSAGNVNRTYNWGSKARRGSQ